MNKINLLLNNINFTLSKKWIWQIISIFVLGIYLFPIIYYTSDINMLVFDNLDSNVVWFKILAESGKIFAANDVIIPNMMSGLPRGSYGSEYNVILWLYYFFTPITAYIINVVIIHFVAFISMHTLLNNYIIKKEQKSRYLIIYFVSIYYALLPYWPSAGLTFAIIPLITYILTAIYYKEDKLYHWIILIFIPLYSSFILFYVFYISFAFLVLFIISLKKRYFHFKLFFALTLLTIIFLAVEYRTVEMMFYDPLFISHRVEFDAYFNKKFILTITSFYNFFLNGHETYTRSLHMPYLLPVILLGIFISQKNKRYDVKESLIIYILILLGFISAVWSTLLINLYFVPAFFLIATYLIIKTDKTKNIGFLIYLTILFSFFYAFSFYEGFSFLEALVPIFKSFNISRSSFLQPFVWSIIIAMALSIITNKLRYQNIFITLLLLFQFSISYKTNLHTIQRNNSASSFNNYYAEHTFDQVKNILPKDLSSFKVVSYGLEPAVSLYNGFYTVDGYSVNYPLTYKKEFRPIIAKYLDDPAHKDISTIYDSWGSKVYILSISSSLTRYRKGQKVSASRFSTQSLCNLDTDYLISAYELVHTKKYNLEYIKGFKGDPGSWDVYLYKLECP